jgi:hypothetical protein
MWQDLGLLSQLPLQTDLETYWHKQAFQWQQETSDYRPAAFLQYATEKHAAVTVWPWLPAQWLWSVLDQCLVQPHMNAQYLLHPANLYPLLQEHIPGSAVADSGGLGVGGVQRWYS